MKKILLFGVLILGVTFSGNAQIKNLEERIAILELKTDNIKNEYNSSKTFNDILFGGYGELHYNNLSGDGGANDKEKIDFHRFVLFIGHSFNDWISFNSEVEIEHALSGEGKPGEVEIEQAYIDFDLNNSNTIRVGLFLLPIGFLNETHEPPLFYGVERNPVETNIIPTTWWEGGLGAYGSFGKTGQYRIYIHSGFKTSIENNYSIRKGRQKVAEAKASDLAATMALKWNFSKIIIGGSLQYQSDISQSDAPNVGGALLGELHLNFNLDSLSIRAMFARWLLDGQGPESVGADEQYGWFIEPSYRLNDYIGVFFRYNEWNNQAGASLNRGVKEQIDVGGNYWPHENVVIKIDYQWQNNQNEKNQNGVNLGIGYQF